MGESLVTRAAGGSEAGSEYVFVTKVISKNVIFIAPEARSNAFSVFLYGAGAGGEANQVYSNGACGGYMNNAEFTLTPGQAIPITIGSGGMGGICTRNSGVIGKPTEGAITTFGTLLSANGGGISEGGSGGGGRGWGRTGYQFGGGGGGGSGAAGGGKGGIWGGGGGGANRSTATGTGGLNGGNGGISGMPGQNGINTIGFLNIPSHLRGAGVGGTNMAYQYGGGGGGGGYGGNGGNGNWIGSNGGGGGGGGYGGRGGDGGDTAGGGGGGYGGRGGDAIGYSAGSGGGYGDAGISANYTSLNNSIVYAGNGGIGAGGGSISISDGLNYTVYGGRGGDGICIIKYYAPTKITAMDMSDI